MVNRMEENELNIVFDRIISIAEAIVYSENEDFKDSFHDFLKTNLEKASKVNQIRIRQICNRIKPITTFDQVPTLAKP